MSYTFSKVKLGAYEFDTNPISISKPRELMQQITRSINGRAQGSYVPTPGNDTKILTKKQFKLSGEDNTGNIIEQIQAEIEKAPPLYFRNAEGEEFLVTVDGFDSTQEASLYETRPWTLSLSEA